MRIGATFSGIKMTEPEILDTKGVLMTEIICPSCRLEFRLDGNCDGVLVECPTCEVMLRVTCE